MCFIDMRRQIMEVDQVLGPLRPKVEEDPTPDQLTWSAEHINETYGFTFIPYIYIVEQYLFGNNSEFNNCY